MEFRDFANHFQNQQLISSQEIENAFGEKARVQLSRWVEKSLITRIRRGQYILNSKTGEIDRELLANEIKNSYISLEYALNKHNLIPEVPQKITSATTERSETVETRWGVFVYQHLQPALFTGYELSDSHLSQRKIQFATPTKALFDFIYFTKLSGTDGFDELRLNKGILKESFDKNLFQFWLKNVSRPSLVNRLESFLRYLESDAQS